MTPFFFETSISKDFEARVSRRIGPAAAAPRISLRAREKALVSGAASAPPAGVLA